MFGVLLTILCALGAAGWARWVLAKVSYQGDIAFTWGISALLGLGTYGFALLPIGLLPGGVTVATALLPAIALVGLVHFKRFKSEISFAKPEKFEWLFVAAIGIAILFALIGTLAPSNTFDWDSLAYHLAVPKLWLQAGQIQYIPYIHHSNFPAVVDSLYAYGLRWGGQPGAKAYSTAYFCAGALALFGLARSISNRNCAWWAVLAFVTIPAALWEAGTAYVDLANGLFVGFGILLTSRYIAQRNRQELWIGAIMLGFAAGSKYTGLQTVGIACLVLLVGLSFKDGIQRAWKPAVFVGVLAFAIASPWYVKNVVWTSNPVYPFFYSKFSSTKNWSEFNARIYTEQQNTFGVGQKDRPWEKDYVPHPKGGHFLSQIGNSILGLAYQPGRYTDPSPTEGRGFPFQILGGAVIVLLCLSLLAGSTDTFVRSVLAQVVLGFMGWFLVSQQSRYIMGNVVPLTILASYGIANWKSGRIMAVVIGIQAVVTLYMANLLTVSGQIQVALGAVSREQYQEKNVRFYRDAQFLNEAAKGGKVALYNEVFGSLLDVPYFWANPGHSTLIPYETIETGDQLADQLKALGFTHAYLPRGGEAEPFQTRWYQAMGLVSPPQPFTDAEKKEMGQDLRNKWKYLFADAVVRGRFQLLPDSPRGLIFTIK